MCTVVTNINKIRQAGAELGQAQQKQIVFSSDQICNKNQIQVDAELCQAQGKLRLVRIE